MCSDFQRVNQVESCRMGTLGALRLQMNIVPDIVKSWNFVAVLIHFLDPDPKVSGLHTTKWTQMNAHNRICIGFYSSYSYGHEFGEIWIGRNYEKVEHSGTYLRRNS